MGESIKGIPAHELLKRGLAMVPEGRGIFSRMSIVENMQMGAYLRNDTDAIKADVDRMFGFFPRLKERATQYAGTLSGGEQQMVAVGRALMLRPKLLLLDEPSHGLAPKVVEEMHEAFKAIHSRGTSILLVEQNVELALEVASRGYVLEAGRVTLKGTAAELRANPAVVAAYLGV